MRPQDNFNIITGQVKRPLPTNSTSKRFQSLDLIKNQKIKGGYNYDLAPVKKLGKAKDQNMFVYTYTGNDPIKNIYKTKDLEQSLPNFQQTDSAVSNRTFNQPKASLINATKLEYNIISNTYQGNAASTNWGQTKRRHPISKFIHDGRTYAPNYTQGYQKKQNQKEFTKKRNLCTDICEIQKHYGTGKFFRKLK